MYDEMAGNEKERSSRTREHHSEPNLADDIILQLAKNIEDALRV